MSDSRHRYRGGSRGGRSLPLKLTKVTFFTMILYNLESTIRDIRPIRAPIVLSHQCCEVGYTVLHVAYSSQLVMRLDCKILLKSSPP